MLLRQVQVDSVQGVICDAVHRGTNTKVRRERMGHHPRGPDEPHLVLSLRPSQMGVRNIIRNALRSNLCEVRGVNAGDTALKPKQLLAREYWQHAIST